MFEVGGEEEHSTAPNRFFPRNVMGEIYFSLVRFLKFFFNNNFLC